jgi:hypothetical protein
MVSADEPHEGRVEAKAADRRNEDDDCMAKKKEPRLVYAELASDDHVHREGGAGGEDLDAKGQGAALENLFEICVGVSKTVDSPSDHTLASGVVEPVQK